MAVTIYVGKNTFFLDSLDAVQKPDEENNVPDPNTADWNDLAGPGVPQPAVQQAPPRWAVQQIQRRRRRVIRKLEPLIEKVREGINNLLPGSGATGGPGFILPAGIDSDAIGRCKEQIQINRLDEDGGYVVTHTKPTDPKKVKKAVGEAAALGVEVGAAEGEEWKGSGKSAKIGEAIANVVESVGALRGLSLGPAEIYGFDTADEAVEFVREACSRVDLE